MNSKKENRAAKILETLTKTQKEEVSVLADMLKVSEVTVRKDLDALESKGLIQRVHGYAKLNSPDNINGRLAFHYEVKKRIASRASKLVHDGDTIMIESGSSCAILADLLSETRKNITIITNSAFIADYIKESPNVQIILLGGIYQKNTQCLVGPMIRDTASGYSVHHFFIGTDGWSMRTGFTNKDQLRAQAVRDMAHSCEHVTVLTESNKFDDIGTVPINIKDLPISVITDCNLSAGIQNKMKSEGIEVIEV